MKQMIDVPKGFRLVKVSDTEYKLVPDKHTLPTSWPEFCRLEWEQGYHEMKMPMYTFASDGLTREALLHTARDPMKEFGFFSTRELVNAYRALMMLTHLRNWYNDNWVPNWADEDQIKYCLVLYNTGWTFTTSYCKVHFFAFQTRDLAIAFLENFRHLLKLLQPLIGYGMQMDLNTHD